eukprot:768399-Hanusia_phi.AAC.10
MQGGVWADEAEGIEDEDDMEDFLDSCDDSAEEEEEAQEVLPSLMQWAQSNQATQRPPQEGEHQDGVAGEVEEGMEKARKEALQTNRELHSIIVDMLNDIEKIKEKNREKWKDMQAQRQQLMRIIDGRKIDKFRTERWREGRQEMVIRKEDSDCFFGFSLHHRCPLQPSAEVEHRVAGWRLTERRVLVNEVANCCKKQLFLQGQSEQLKSAKKHAVLLSEPCRKVLTDPKLWEEVGRIMWRKLKRGSEECFVQFMNVDDPKITKQDWSKEEEKILVSAVRSGQTWAEIGKKIEDQLGRHRPPVDLFTYYQRVHNRNLVKTGIWTKEEDEVLMMV